MENVKNTGATEDELRALLVKTAQSFLGCNEGDGTHKKIIDLYNSHTPLARSYKVKYSDAWCSTYASAVAIKAEMTDIIPTECGCEKHIQRFKDIGAWQESDAYVPKPADYIFYDWDDTGSGDCTGHSDHVGIVVSVSGSSMKIIEGNISNAVGYRNLKANGKYIRGYGVPKYSRKTAIPGESVKVPEQVDATDTPDADPEVDDIVDFVGSKHYTSASAKVGYECKPGKAKVTQKWLTGIHKYHLVAVKGGGSTVHGWVDASDIREVKTAESTAKSEINVGDTVNFTGKVHYKSANALIGPACRPGKAKVTDYKKGAKHPYHVVKVQGGGSTVYGWVNEDDVSPL